VHLWWTGSLKRLSARYGKGCDALVSVQNLQLGHDDFVVSCEHPTSKVVHAQYPELCISNLFNCACARS
jgi:hypothetical protein